MPISRNKSYSQCTVNIWGRRMNEIKTEACIEQFQIEYRLRLSSKTIRSYIFGVSQFFDFLKMKLILQFSGYKFVHFLYFILLLIYTIDFFQAVAIAGKKTVKKLCLRSLFVKQRMQILCLCSVKLQLIKIT